MHTDRASGEERGRELLSPGSLPKGPQQPGLETAAPSLSPQGWQAPKRLGGSSPAAAQAHQQAAGLEAETELQLDLGQSAHLDSQGDSITCFYTASRAF